MIRSRAGRAVRVDRARSGFIRISRFGERFGGRYSASLKSRENIGTLFAGREGSGDRAGQGKGGGGGPRQNL